MPPSPLTGIYELVYIQSVMYISHNIHKKLDSDLKADAEESEEPENVPDLKCKDFCIKQDQMYIFKLSVKDLCYSPDIYSN